MNKIKSRRLLFVQMLFTAVAFLLMVVLSYSFASSIVNNSLARYADALITSAQAQIESELTESTVTLGSQAQSIRSMILRGSSADEVQEYIEEQSVYLQDIGTRMTGINDLYGYFEAFPGGAFMTGGIHKDLPSIANLEHLQWFQDAEAAEGEVAQTIPYRCESSGGAVVTFSRCIVDDEGNRLGIVCLDIQVYDFGKHIVEISLDRGGYGMLIDQNLNIIAHANPEFLGRSLRDPAVPLSEYADDILAGDDISHHSFMNWNGENTVAFLREMSNGWYIGLLTPSGPFYQGVTNMMIILCTLGTTLAAILIGIIVRIDNSKNKADAESRQKSAFLANMSHEMRTPMNAIIGMTSLGKSADNTERKNYCLTKIEDASHHLLGVINDILDMSRIEANKFEISPVEFNFGKMLKRVVNVLTFRVDEKQQRLTMKIDSNIPEMLVGDDQRLAQVVTNLLGNAVKFTPETGTISLTADLLEENGDGCIVRIAVADTGIGISGEQQDGLFRAFQQAESSTTRKYGGTGLGLSISKNIMELMGGEIRIESELGKGSTFFVDVPLKKSSERSEGVVDLLHEQKKETPDYTGVFSGRRVLLAEDVEINREIVMSLLEPTCLKIDVAENGAEAVRIFSSSPEKYDLVLMDIQMPEMDGYEATRCIRRMNIPKAASIPIVAMTANVFREDVERCMEAGMSSHIGKPLDYEDVMNKLCFFLQRDYSRNKVAEAS